VLASFNPAKLAPGLIGGIGGSLWTFRIFMVFAAIGTVLAAGYLLWMLQRVAFGQVKEEWEGVHIHDVHVPEWIAWTPLLGLIVALGVYPNLVFDMTNHAVTNVSKVFGG
jgi:NADH-quinone oxidoreductase subunit M